VGEFADRDVFDTDRQYVKERMRNSKAKETFDIVMPDAVLNQSAVLPQSPWSATDNIKSKCGAKNYNVSLSGFCFNECQG
jgi:hypothetical protein